MPTKTKKLGKANDRGTPEAELMLAKLIAAAKSRKLLACRGSYFIGEPYAPHNTTHVYYNKVTTHCCAMGAAELDNIDIEPYYGLSQGNDSMSSAEGSPGYHIGQAFYDACEEL